MFAGLEPIFVANTTSTRQTTTAPRPTSAETAAALTVAASTVAAPTAMAASITESHGRAGRRLSFSSSSEESDVSDKDNRDDDNASEDQFYFSAGNTPSTEHAPMSMGASYSAPRDSLLMGKHVVAAISDAEKSSITTHSKPITIEVPHSRRINLDHAESVPAITPPEPLSARGDIPGGYFPFHEDPKSRVRQPHPFHLDSDQTSRRPAKRKTSGSPLATASVASMPSPLMPPPMSTSTHTPLSSYLPIGVHDGAALPLGKYYPSNYERRQQQRLEARARAAAGGGGASVPAKSESQVPRLRREASHARSSSEVKRRLLQYQRDMVAQASIAASALLSRASSSSEPSAAAALPAIQLSESILRTHKPLSPRLAPLGSPGPVTPMSLESDGDSYLTKGATAVV